MSSWLDRWAKRAAREAPPAERVHSVPASQAHSRRDFMKKAGVVGGLAWSVPVLQTALAPAASASVPGCLNVCGGVCPLCSAGQSVCTANSQCYSNVCSAGVCQKAVAGGTCGSNVDCISNVCSAGVCQAGGIGATCVTNGDCSAGQCSQRTGGPKTCGGPGSTCSGNGGCTNGNCGGGICGGHNATCPSVGANATCADTYTCQQNGTNIWCRT